METRAAAGKGMLMKNANKSARVPQCVSTQQLPKSTPPRIQQLPKSTPPRTQETEMMKKRAEEEMKKKAEEDERKRKQRERVRETRKWAESQDLTPYLEKLRREKEGVSVHESEKNRGNEEVETGRAVINSEPARKEGVSSQATTTMPETEISLSEGTMRNLNFEVSRVEQCLNEVINTVTTEVEPEAVSRLEVVEATKEVEKRQEASTVTREREPGVVSNLEVVETTKDVENRQEASTVTRESEPEVVSNLGVVETIKDVENRQGASTVTREREPEGALELEVGGPTNEGTVGKGANATIIEREPTAVSGVGSDITANEEVETREAAPHENPDEIVQELSELIKSITIIEHHMAFSEECISNSVYPLGLKTFVPCVTYKADNYLKEQWKKILHNTSCELLALCKTHFVKLFNNKKERMEQIEAKLDKIVDEEMRKKCEDRKIELLKEKENREKEMKQVRTRKLKHAIKIHKEGRIFTEECLRQKDANTTQNSVNAKPKQTLIPQQRGEPQGHSIRANQHNDKVVDEIVKEKPMGRGKVDSTVTGEGSKGASSCLTDKPVGRENVGSTDGGKRHEHENWRNGRNQRWVPWGRHNEKHPWWERDYRHNSLNESTRERREHEWVRNNREDESRWRAHKYMHGGRSEWENKPRGETYRPFIECEEYRNGREDGDRWGMPRWDEDRGNRGGWQTGPFLGGDEGRGRRFSPGMNREYYSTWSSNWNRKQYF